MSIGIKVLGIACAIGIAGSCFQTAIAAAAPASPPFPPKTIKQAEALAATANLSLVHVFSFQVTGLQSCTRVVTRVTVPPSLTGRRLAAALLDVYFERSQLRPTCGQDVFAYHFRSESGPNSPGGGVYTAGRVDFQIQDTKPKHTLEVDLGSGDGDGASSEFVITY